VQSPGALLLQSLRSLARHKTRTALNALVIAVGVASVVWVIAIGEAGGERATAHLHALGDNLVWVEAGARSISGVRTGTYGMRNLTLEDGEAILREVPQIRSMTPNADGTLLVIGETRNWTTHWRERRALHCARPGVARAHPAALAGDCPRLLGGDRDRLRLLPGAQGRAARPHRGPAIGVTSRSWRRSPVRLR
jgi:hypothetical protein